MTGAVEAVSPLAVEFLLLDFLTWALAAFLVSRSKSIWTFRLLARTSCADAIYVNQYSAISQVFLTITKICLITY